MKNKILYTAIVLIALFFIVKNCQSEPIIKTETKIEHVTVFDTIIKTKIDTIPKIVYVQKIKLEKGKDSIIYRGIPNSTTIKANQYNTKLESNNATASLKITTTGELLDVTGVIDFTQENTTITHTKIKHVNGLFLYGETSIKPILKKLEIGLDYVTKKNIIGVNIEYINGSPQPVLVNAKIGFKIF